MSLEALTPTPATAAVSGAAAVRSGAESAAQGAPAPAPAPAPQAAPAAPAPAGKDAGEQAAELEAARRSANQALKKNGCELAFEFDDASGRMIARLIDTKTKEVLRQMPSKETLAIAKALAEDRSNGVLLQANA